MHCTVEVNVTKRNYVNAECSILQVEISQYIVLPLSSMTRNQTSCKFFCCFIGQREQLPWERKVDQKESEKNLWIVKQVFLSYSFIFRYVALGNKLYNKNVIQELHFRKLYLFYKNKNISGRFDHRPAIHVN